MTAHARTPLFVGHILEAIGRIQGYVQGMDESAFVASKLVQDAVVRNLEVIGEACNNIRKLDPAFVAAHPEVPWGDAIGNRNALSHGYFQIDFVLVWKTVTIDLPALGRAVFSLPLN